MKLFNIIKISLKNIKSNKLRSFLTMLGLVIGIASVIILVGIGNGATSSVKDSVQSLGTDVLTMTINSDDSTLGYSKETEIEELQNVEKIAPYKKISATVNRGNTSSSGASVIATNENYLDITNISTSKGRNLSQIDIENSTKVCILGSDIADSLFENEDSIGKTIKLNGDNYTVIGILSEQGSNMGNSVDSSILIPISTAKFFGENTDIQKAYIKVEDENKIDMTSNIIENYLREELQISSDYYSVETQSSMLDAMEDISSTLSLLLGGIASISLIVGGIGVMNVMLISVTERTKEIGIRKSLGAKKIDILVQFLIEALVLSLLGGLIGILSGIFAGKAIEKLGYTFVATNSIIAISFISSALIGLIFGIFPAYRAASLKPIDALRTE